MAAEERKIPSTWLTALGWVSLASGFVSAAYILVDIYGRGFRLQMPVMEAVWPVTALYLGPVAVWGYARFGRPTSPAWLAARGLTHPPRKPHWAVVATGVSHCGAGCTLGDIAAEFAVFGTGLHVAGTALPYEYAADYVLAVLLGLAFQYFAIAPMRGLGVREGIKAAAQADILSLTAFEVGLFGWMAIMTYVFFPAPHHLAPNSAAYWFLMQVGMIAGFGTARPANVCLLKRGIKEAM